MHSIQLMCLCCQKHDSLNFFFFYFEHTCVSFFFQAKYNVLSGNYPISTIDALILGGILAYIENGIFDPEVHTSGAFK